MAPEAEAAFAELREEEPERRAAGDHLARPAARRLDCRTARAPGRRPGIIVAYRAGAGPAGAGRGLGDVLDGHPATHAWLGSVRGQRVVPLGPDHFGQSGDIPDLYREYGIDTDAILDACAQALLSV